MVEVLLSSFEKVLLKLVFPLSELVTGNPLVMKGRIVVGCERRQRSICVASCFAQESHDTQLREREREREIGCVGGCVGLQELAPSTFGSSP